MRSYTHKKKMARKQSQTGRLAQALSLSLYPDHLSLLQEREREFNIPRSILMQLLLDIERHRGLLRPEIVARIKAACRRIPTPRRAR